MTKHATDCAWSSGAVSTRRPLASDRRSKTGMRRWYRASAARVGEHLVPVDGDAAPRPALEQVAELLRHLLVERRLGGLRALLRVEERDREHLAVRGDEHELSLVAGESLHQRTDDRLRLVHRALGLLGVNPFEARDASDHGFSF